jgi:hypothetical protein
MSQFFSAPTRPDTAAGAIAQHLRVKTPGALVVAGASDIEIGTMEIPATAAGPATVRLRTAEGTAKMVASEAITAGDPVYAAAGGKVAATGTVFVGNAMEAAGANNDVIEVLRGPNTDISTSISGTTAATFEADSDLGKPRAALGSQTGGTGDFKAVIRPPSTLGADRVFTLDGDANATIANVATAQTLTNKTLASPIHTGLARQSHTVSPVAATGSTVADAAALNVTNVNHITSDSAAKGVKLTTVAAGDWGIVINNSSTAAEFYAASGGTVNGLSANASVVIPASKGLYWVATGADTVIAFDLTAKATAS